MLLRAAIDSKASPVRLVKILGSRIWLDRLRIVRLDGIVHQSSPLDKPDAEKIKLGFYFHLFHEDYLERFFELTDVIKSTEISAAFFVTTSSSKIAHSIRARELAKFTQSITTVAICQNRGRNFGPLFVEFAETFGQFDYCIHLHSKKSEQIARHRSESWSLTNWGFLGMNSDLLMKTIDLMQDRKNISLAFAWNQANTPLSAFTWGLNKRFGQLIATTFKTKISRELVIYPVGGMFLARGEFLAHFSKLLPLQYEDFPEECGQVDGCLQHAVERALGFISEALGGEILIFNEITDSFFLGSELHSQLGDAWL